MGGMVNHPRQRSRLWASLLLLFALLAVQPVWAAHIHLDNSASEQCDLCFNHMPAALGSEYRFEQADLSPLYRAQQAPVARDCQPERQSARAPPILSHA